MMLFDLRNKPKAADHAGAFDAFEFRRRLPGGHECFAFRLPFPDKLFKQSVFFNRSGHFLAGRRILGGWSSVAVLIAFLRCFNSFRWFVRLKEMTNDLPRAGHRRIFFGRGNEGLSQFVLRFFSVSATSGSFCPRACFSSALFLVQRDARESRPLII